MCWLNMLLMVNPNRSLSESDCNKQQTVVIDFKIWNSFIIFSLFYKNESFIHDWQIELLMKHFKELFRRGKFLAFREGNITFLKILNYLSLPSNEAYRYNSRNWLNMQNIYVSHAGAWEFRNWKKFSNDLHPLHKNERTFYNSVENPQGIALSFKMLKKETQKITI